MSIMPRYVKCKKCKNVYSWSSTTEIKGCPNCGSRRYKLSPTPFPAPEPRPGEVLDIIKEVLNNHNKPE